MNRIPNPTRGGAYVADARTGSLRPEGEVTNELATRHAPESNAPPVSEANPAASADGASSDALLPPIDGDGDGVDPESEPEANVAEQPRRRRWFGAPHPSTNEN